MCFFLFYFWKNNISFLSEELFFKYKLIIILKANYNKRKQYQFMNVLKNI